MSVSDQPKYSSDSFVLQTAGNRHVFRTVHLHLSVWRSVGYWHLTVCYRPGPLAGYCCVHSALINYEWMRMGEDTWLLVWETVYLYWRQGGPRWGELRYLSVRYQYAAGRDSVEAQTSYICKRSFWSFLYALKNKNTGWLIVDTSLIDFLDLNWNMQEGVVFCQHFIFPYYLISKV